MVSLRELAVTDRNENPFPREIPIPGGPPGSLTLTRNMAQYGFPPGNWPKTSENRWKTDQKWPENPPEN